MDGVGTPIIGRPRPLPGHDTPNPAYHPHTLNYEEPDYLTVMAAKAGKVYPLRPGVEASWGTVRGPRAWMVSYVGMGISA